MSNWRIRVPHLVIDQGDIQEKIMRLLILPTVAAALVTAIMSYPAEAASASRHWHHCPRLLWLWHRTLLARRADRQSADLAKRILPGKRSGSLHSLSVDAGSDKS